MSTSSIDKERTRIKAVIKLEVKMYKKISSIIEYVGWLIKKQIELQQNQEVNFKIIKVSQNNVKDDILQIQVCKKNAIFNCKPSEITSFESLLEGFSKNEMETIKYLANKKDNSSKTQIISYRFCEKIKRFVMKIKKPDSPKINEFLATELSKNKQLIDSLSQQDAYRLGYISAMEQLDLERQVIKSKKIA